MKPIQEVDEGLESRVEALGMELVEIAWAGRAQRPIIRIRVDHRDPAPGEGVTVGDCARVSRELEPWLDAHPSLSERYVLEVSSPGVDRPLKRKGHFERFVGQEVRIKTGGAGGGAPRSLRGVLDGVEEGEDGYRIVVRRPDGSTLRIPGTEVLGANLVFRWKDED